MGLQKNLTPAVDLTAKFNSLYNLTFDVSGWDKMTVQFVAPVLGTTYVYGSLDSGYQQQTTQGDASKAINFTPILATNLATGATAASITAAGLYRVQANDQQFVRLQGNPVGSPTNVYRIIVSHTKTM